MDKTTQWLCLLGGIFLFVIGIKELYQDGQWVLLVISILIIAFTLSAIIKARQKER